MQSTFLYYLTDTTLDIYNLLSLPVHYGLELCVWIQQHQGSTRHSNGAAKALQRRTHCQESRRRHFGDVDLRRRIKKVLTFQFSDAVLNEGNAAAQDQRGPALFQMSMAHFKHLSESGYLKWTKIKRSDSNCQVNDVVMLSWIATRLCQDAVRFGAARLGRRELTDRQVSGFVFPGFLENTEETKAS